MRHEKENIKGAHCVRDDAGILRSAEDRAVLFGDFLANDTWKLKPESQGLCPPELLNIQMVTDPWELDNALKSLNCALASWEIAQLRKGLQRGKSRKPSGIGYEYSFYSRR